MEIEKIKKLASKWIDNCGDSSIIRMYGHHMRSFIAGAESQQKQIEELKAENERLISANKYERKQIGEIKTHERKIREGMAKENTKLKAEKNKIHKQALENSQKSFIENTKLKEGIQNILDRPDVSYCFNTEADLKALLKD